jgi:hypothetical protein
MVAEDTRQRIAAFLRQQLFAPILDGDPNLYPVFRRAEAEDARRQVTEERHAIFAAPSAGAMLLAYHEAVDRSAATGLEGRLDELRLPNFGSIRNELDKLAAELAVSAEPVPDGQIS